MKQRLIAAACCAAVILGGCQPSSGLLNKYSEMELLTSSDVLSLVEPEKGEGFAADLAVVPVSDNDASVSDSAITTNAALLICTNTQEALYYKNIYESLAPASLTKLMTGLLVLKYGNMDDIITITPDMVDITVPGAQMAGFAAGDQVSVRDLFYSMLIYSGNDTSTALGIYISGSVEEFADLMNSEAASLGAANTHFVNACGLDADGHETCAYDLYLMFNACMEYEEFRDAISQSSYTVNYTSASGAPVSKTFETTNLCFAGEYTPPEGVTVFGGKTGTTDNAGACLILSTTDDLGNSYIALILGGDGKPELYQQMSSLLLMIQKN